MLEVKIKSWEWERGVGPGYLVSQTAEEGGLNCCAMGAVAITVGVPVEKLVNNATLADLTEAFDDIPDLIYLLESKDVSEQLIDDLKTAFPEVIDFHDLVGSTRTVAGAVYNINDYIMPTLRDSKRLWAINQILALADVHLTVEGIDAPTSGVSV